jgi:ribosome-associated protein
VETSVLRINESLSLPLAELEFHSSRSGGPGGQNVNKLETRVELLFDLEQSPSLTADQRELLRSNLHSKIDQAGILRVVAQESRSQWQNKQHAIKKFVLLLRKGLHARKKRIGTKPSKRVKEKRLQSKKILGEKKRMRKVPIE